MLQISHVKEVDTLRQRLLAQGQKLEAASDGSGAETGGSVCWLRGRNWRQRLLAQGQKLEAASAGSGAENGGSVCWLRGRNWRQRLLAQGQKMEAASAGSGAETGGSRDWPSWRPTSPRRRTSSNTSTRHKQRSHQWTDGRTDGRPHALPCAGFDHTPKSILPKEYPSLRAKLRKDNPTVPVTKRLWSCLKHCHSCSHCVSHPSQGQKLEGETGQAGDPPIQEGAP
ncbi:uncharacterized protein LOC124863188 isoform X3 [Girardinichthys multiradiatus]|uniref:uncharacterized protein LOC124863188 isoform X3 n=1 Tax=Girardinichthys multiradiatus TaxID=208333 RepID=UPI001FAD0E22|nr:uncharacterized protein LOC124863188 isoform X3 [Girardinichthys multiradiatus]